MVCSPLRITKDGAEATKVFSCWLTKTINSVQVDRIRYQTAQKRGSGKSNVCSLEELGDREDNSPSDEKPEAFYGNLLNKRSIFLTLSNQPEPYGRAILHYYKEGCSLSEAAGKFGLKPSQLRGQLKIFKKELKEIRSSYGKIPR
jgi:DNA-directed RNA polymerase specialized sigma24 family protein